MRNWNTLEVGRWYAGYWTYEAESRILIYFNLSSIPPNAVIQSAELRLYYIYGSNNQGDQYYVCRLTEDWGDERNDYDIWDLGWTYNRPYHVCSNINSTVPSAAGWMSWDVTDDVKGFLNGSYTNYGWMIKDISRSYNSRSYFDSKESTNKPQLIITYSTTSASVPELTPFGLLAVAGLVVIAIAVRNIPR